MKFTSLLLLTVALGVSAPSVSQAYELTCTNQKANLRFEQRLVFGGPQPAPGLHSPHWYLNDQELNPDSVSVDDASKKIISEEPVNGSSYFTKQVFTELVQVHLEGPEVPPWASITCITYLYSGPPIP